MIKLQRNSVSSQRRKELTDIFTLSLSAMPLPTKHIQMGPAGTWLGYLLGIEWPGHHYSWLVCFFSLFRTSRATWRTDRDMGLMNAIGLQPRNPTTSVTSQGTQTLAPQLQNAETQTEREVQEQGATSSGTGEGKSLSSNLFTSFPASARWQGALVHRDLLNSGWGEGKNCELLAGDHTIFMLFLWQQPPASGHLSLILAALPLLAD